MMRRLNFRSSCCSSAFLRRRVTEAAGGANPILSTTKRYQTAATAAARSGDGSEAGVATRIGFAQRVWQFAGAATALTVAIGCGVVLLWPLVDAFGLPFVMLTAMKQSTGGIEFLPSSTTAASCSLRDDDVEGAIERDAYFTAAAVGHHLRRREPQSTTTDERARRERAIRNCDDGKGKVVVVTAQQGSFKNDMLKHLHYILRFGDVQDQSTPRTSSASLPPMEHTRPVIYVNCKSFIDTGTFLYGTLNALFGPSLGSFGYIVIAYHKLFNAAVDFITLNQNHQHVSYTIFNQTLAHLHVALQWLKNERHRRLQQRLRDVSSPPGFVSSLFGSLGNDSNKPLDARPLFVLDGLENLVSLRGDGDKRGLSDHNNEFVLFPHLLCASLLHWAADENLCDLVVLGDVSVLDQTPPTKRSPSNGDRLWTTKLAQAFPDLVRTAQHTTLSGMADDAIDTPPTADGTLVEQEEQALTTATASLLDRTGCYPLLTVSALRLLHTRPQDSNNTQQRTRPTARRITAITPSALARACNVSSTEAAHDALQGLRQSGLATASLRRTVSRQQQQASCALQHGATNPEIATQAVLFRNTSSNRKETNQEEEEQTTTPTSHPLVAASAKACLNLTVMCQPIYANEAFAVSSSSSSTATSDEHDTAKRNAAISANISSVCRSVAQNVLVAPNTTTKGCPVTQTAQVPLHVPGGKNQSPDHWLSLEDVKTFLAENVGGVFGNKDTGIAVLEPFSALSSSEQRQWTLLSKPEDVLLLSNGCVVCPAIGFPCQVFPSNKTKIESEE